MRRFQPRQLRDPAPDINALRIVSRALQHRIEDTEIGRRVGAGARHPLPACRVVGGVRVAKRVPEPGLAAPPVDQEMFDQKRRGDHANAIVHVACRPELAHPGVDDRIARQPARPGVKPGGVLAKGEALEAPLPRASGQLGKPVEQRVGKLAPTELGDEFLGRTR